MPARVGTAHHRAHHVLRLQRLDESRSEVRHLASIGAPSKVIFLAESGDAVTQDHFAPYFWGASHDPDCGMPPAVFTAQNPVAWNAASQEPRNINVRRHQEGFNAAYADGHAKWQRWTQVYWQEGDVRQGNFAPRQQ
jgi:prepilin-type processing-associated H-X9-DG protein